jgi:hypothetical protein
MKVKGFATVDGHPEAKGKFSLNPIHFETSVHANMDLHVGSISAEISEVPIRLAIPFMKRKARKLMVIGSVGGIKVRLEPLRVTAERLSLDMEGVLGTKGIEGQAEGEMSCESRVKGKGLLEGTIVIPPIIFKEDDESEGEGCE